MRHARKAADAQRACARVVLLGGLLQERVARADHILNIGQQVLARARQADALTVALEQRTADFGLQFVDQVLTLATFGLLFGLMLFATYNDILRLITGTV